mgnify:CR=1 FL=1|jgi:uncharacterized protein (TIGR00251 family)
MKINIKVKSSSSQEKVEKIDDQNYLVWLKEKPIDGKANVKLMKILRKYFKKEVEITSGLTSKNKIIEIKNEI